MSHSISTFEACCAKCGAIFAAPHLGDFVYGSFLLFGDRGTVYSLLEAFDNPVWSLAESLGCSNMLRAVAAVTDRVDGQSMCAEQICPMCQSHQWKYWGGKRVASVDVVETTFDAFNKLSHADQVHALLKDKPIDPIH